MTLPKAKIQIIIATIIAVLLTATAVTIDQRKLLPIKASFNQLTPAAQKEVLCLADNILFEAGYEPRDGQLAVAVVTLNRLKSGNYADSICGVVKQKTGNTCQFSWWCEEKPRTTSITRNLTSSQQSVYNSILDFAVYTYLNFEIMTDNTKGATYYHADYVNPHWKNLRKTVQIGRHIFYKNGEVDVKYDEKTQSGTGAGRSIPLVFFTDGRDYNGYLQANYRMDF
jgi:spore germination cell wall hydrolase CwlJ-like protein